MTIYSIHSWNIIIWMRILNRLNLLVIRLMRYWPSCWTLIVNSFKRHASIHIFMRRNFIFFLRTQIFNIERRYRSFYKFILMIRQVNWGLFLIRHVIILIGELLLFCTLINIHSTDFINCDTINFERILLLWFGDYLWIIVRAIILWSVKSLESSNCILNFRLLFNILFYSWVISFDRISISLLSIPKETKFWLLTHFYCIFAATVLVFLIWYWL